VGERHLQRVGDKLGPHVIGHGPADDPARVRVEQHRQVEPPLPCRDIRDVAKPEAIRPRRREVARHQVRRGRVRRVGDRRARPSPPVAADEARRPHQPGDALAGAAHPGGAQLGVDARRAWSCLTSADR